MADERTQTHDELTKTPYFKLRKRLLIVAFFLRFFVCGAEYSVILPTALIYLKSLSAGYVFMGFVVAAYPFAAMISLPLFGYLYDKTKRLKELLLILNSFELIGNVLYALPYSKWLPAVGRLTAGIGDGFIALTVGELAYLYPSSERIAILSLMELGRVCGLILGPAVNFAINKKTYMINGWLLDNKTLPGVIMATCWLIMQFITVCCVFNLAHEITTKRNLEKEMTEKDLTISEDQTSAECSEATSFKDSCIPDDSLLYTDSLGDASPGSSDESDKEDKELLSHNESSEKKDSDGDKNSLFSVLKQIYAFEFFVLFCVDIALWYSQTIFEILLPYITEFDYHWDPLYTGLVYMVGGAELIFVFGIIIFTSKRVNDVTWLIFALVLTQLSIGLLIYESVLTDLQQRFYLFIGVCFLVFATIPLNLVSTKSLLTKLLPQEIQGTVQGLYSSVSRLALIGGPILGSVVFEKRKLYGAVASVICFFTLIGLFLSLGRIERRRKNMERHFSNSKN
ncbi:uncharacterized protein LOC130655233 [Hydractinia symbiolongicarpus]|uniref:uncharacterized protein LOC130655233 n=1 Tax=Hydractinia symbiolongicarpus TaxID=13093 RepID=UPI00254C6C5C|nr:uncharacterized protein LOC130655233 [Hydractinia symbiolongicarpus]